MNQDKNEFKQYLCQLFPNNTVRTHLIQTLARIVAGDINREKKVLIFQGTGGNGISSFTDLLRETMDNMCVKQSYIDRVNMGSIVDKNLVIVDGPILASFVKSMMSSDSFMYRELYGSPVTFQQHFDLIICANQQFDVTNEYEIIPFDSVFVNHPDPTRFNEYQKTDIKLKFEAWKPIFKEMLLSNINS